MRSRNLVYWLIVIIFTISCISIFLYINTDVIDLPQIMQNQQFQYYKIGHISGRVMNAKTGAPLSDIPVDLVFNCQYDLGFPSNPCGLESKKVFTNKNGKFFIPQDFINFPDGLISFSLHINMPATYTDFSLTYTGLRNKLENGFFPYYSYYREKNFVAKNKLIFTYQTHQKIPKFEIYLVPQVESIFDCTNLRDEKSRAGCISIFSLKSMGEVMSAGSVGAGAPQYFEKYFSLLYEREVNNTCADNPKDYFCITKRAIAENNLSICNEIVDNSNKERNDCEFIATIELAKDCDKVKPLSSNYYYDFPPIDACKFYSAIRHSSSSFCENIHDEISWRPICFRYLAKMKQESNLCYKQYTNKSPQYKSMYESWEQICLEDIKYR